MAVRNFYMNADINGRKTALYGGPSARNGGMSIRITQRNQGGIDDAVSIQCFELDGELNTDVYIGGKFVGRYKTAR